MYATTPAEERISAEKHPEDNDRNARNALHAMLTASHPMARQRLLLEKRTPPRRLLLSNRLAARDAYHARLLSVAEFKAALVGLDASKRRMDHCWDDDINPLAHIAAAYWRNNGKRHGKADYYKCGHHTHSPHTHSPHTHSPHPHHPHHPHDPWLAWGSCMYEGKTPTCRQDGAKRKTSRKSRSENCVANLDHTEGVDTAQPNDPHKVMLSFTRATYAKYSGVQNPLPKDNDEKDRPGERRGKCYDIRDCSLDEVGCAKINTNECWQSWGNWGGDCDVARFDECWQSWGNWKNDCDKERVEKLQKAGKKIGPEKSGVCVYTSDPFRRRWIDNVCVAVSKDKLDGRMWRKRTAVRSCYDGWCNEMSETCKSTNGAPFGGADSKPCALCKGHRRCAAMRSNRNEWYFNRNDLCCPNGEATKGFPSGRHYLCCDNTARQHVTGCVPSTAIAVFYIPRHHTTCVHFLLLCAICP